MKFISTLVLAMLIIFQTTTFAAIETFSANAEYTMTDYDTPEVAEQIVLDFARQNAAEQAGIYLESYSRSENMKLVEDEIKTVASSKVEIIEKKITNKAQKNGWITLHADIKATVDTSELEKFIKQASDKRQEAIQRYKDLHEMDDKLKHDIAELKTKIAALKDDGQDSEIIEEQERINRQFIAKQKYQNFEKLHSSFYQTDVDYNVNPQTVINEAIKTDPKNPHYYISRGIWDQNIDNKFKDYTKAIIVAPNNSNIYYWRAHVYQWDLKNYDKALADYTKAIELAPTNPNHYNELASFYKYALKDNNKAIDVYTKLIQINPANGYRWRGNFYESINEPNKALQDYNQLVQIDPKYGYETRAKLYLKYKKYDNAIKDYEQYAKFDNWAYVEIADIYEDQENYEQAIKYITLLINAKPNDAYYYYHRAYLYKQIEDYQSAVNDYTQAIKFKPNYYSYYYDRAKCYKELKDQKNLLKDYIKIAKLNPEFGNDLLASFYYFNNEYEKAVEYYTKAINITPVDVTLYRDRIKCYEKLNNYAKIIEDYTKLIELYQKDKYVYGSSIMVNKDKNDTLALHHSMRGDYYEKMKYYQNAIADYTKAISLKDEYYYHSARGMCYAAIGDYVHAVEDYNQAIAVNPGNSDYYFLRIMAYCKSGNYHLITADCKKLIELDKEQSIKDSSNEIKLKPQDADNYFVRSMLYINIGNYQLALEDCNKILEMKRNSKEPIYIFTLKQRGDCYTLMKDYKRAIEEYKTVINIEPKYKDAYIYQAFCYMNLQEYQQAIDNCNQVLKFSPDDIDAYIERGVIYYTMQDYDNALKDFDKVLKMNPNIDVVKQYHQKVLEHIKK